MRHEPAIILLTRAKAQNTGFSAQLRARIGNAARIVEAPLTLIQPINATIDLTGVGAVAFTSANGVSEFAKREKTRDSACFCVGARSADAARAVGFAARAAAGDVADLAQLIAREYDAANGVVLHVRGRHAAGDLVGALNARSMPALSVIIYEQCVVPVDDGIYKDIGSNLPLFVPLFSPRSAKIFLDQFGELQFQDAVAICISSNVAKELGDGVFGSVVVAQRPDAASMLDAIADAL